MTFETEVDKLGMMKKAPSAEEHPQTSEPLRFWSNVPRPKLDAPKLDALNMES